MKSKLPEANGNAALSPWHREGADGQGRELIDRVAARNVHPSSSSCRSIASLGATICARNVARRLRGEDCGQFALYRMMTRHAFNRASVPTSSRAINRL
jgi:hypothetical protein